MTEPKEIQLTLPGERRDLVSADAGLGDFAKLLDTEVVTAADVGATRRDRPPPPQQVTANPDDVLVRGWYTGMF
jgi:hypothetical protein